MAIRSTSDWQVIFHPEFEKEVNALTQDVQDELYAHASLLEKIGPNLSRPYADTLKGSKFNNMKELRFNAKDGVWRVAFAFDYQRRAIVLIVGNKKGISKTLFYRKFIHKADQRFAQHLEENPKF